MIMPTEISAEMAQMILDVSNVAGICLTIFVAIWGFRKIRNEVMGIGLPSMTRRERADEIRFLRANGWSNAEIRQGGKGLEP